MSYETFLFLEQIVTIRNYLKKLKIQKFNFPGFCKGKNGTKVYVPSVDVIFLLSISVFKINTFVFKKIMYLYNKNQMTHELSRHAVNCHCFCLGLLSLCLLPWNP